MILLVRVFHTIVALVIYGAIGIVYYSAITDTLTVWFYLATALLVLEGIAISVLKGKCPLLYLHRRYGDEKRFFELVMPWRFAKYVFLCIFIIIIAGYAMILFDLG